MISIIQKLCLALFETALLALFFESIFKRDYDKILQKRIIFVIYFIFQCITYFINSPFFSTCVYYIIFTLFIAWYCYLDSIRIKLIASSMFVTLNYACKLLSVTSYAKYNGQILPSNPFKYVLTDNMQALACTILLMAIVIIIIMRNIKNSITKTIVNIVIFILPLVNLFISMHLLSNQSNIYIEITSLLFCYTFFLFFIIDQIIYSSKADMVSDSMKQRLAFQKLYYKDLQEYSNKMSRLKHDIKNHHNTLYYLLTNNKIEEAKEFIETYNNEYLSIKSIINTGNDVFDVILNAKMNDAYKQNIEVINEIVIPPHLNISSVDISVILGNLLDNAIEATCKLDTNRKITIKIKTYKENLFINISNTFNGQVIKSNNEIVSSKLNSHEHGIGIHNIKHIVKKYKGSFEITYDNNIFNVSILLPEIKNVADTF